MKQVLLFALVLTTVSCTQPKVDKKAEEEKIMQLSREWSQAAASADVNKTMSYWADEAYMVAEGIPPLQGKTAIKEMVEQSYKMPGFRISWEPQSVEVSDNGDMAYMITNSQVSYADSTGKALTQYSKGLSVWKKQSDGTWKTVADISTPDATRNQ